MAEASQTTRVPITFAYQGQQYTFQGDALSIGEAREIKRATGLRVWDFAVGLTLMDPDSVAAMIWVTLRRHSVDVTWDDVDQLDIGEVGQSIADAFQRNKPADGQAFANGTPVSTETPAE